MASTPNHRNTAMPAETLLELVQSQDGEIALRPVEGDGEALVTIRFSDQVHQLLGDQLQGVGQHMVQAALQMIMEQQSARWHAAVLDEEPTHFS
jgi:polyhydroxyalkanoate synthesis regulator protein